MRNARFCILPLASVVLLAQAPAPAPEPAAVSAPAEAAAVPAKPFAMQQFLAEQQEIDRLIADGKPREALEKVEATLPTAPEPYDKRDLKGALDSYKHGAVLTLAYSTAGRAAFAGGYWGKALEYDTKAKDTSAKNYEDSKEAFGAAAEALRAAITQNKAVVEETAAEIAAIRAKPNPDPGEQQQLDLIEQTKATITGNEKWVKICEDNVEASKKTADYYAPRPAETSEWIKKEGEQLSSYKSKAQFVEGAISSAKFMSAFQDKQSKLQYLFRLNVLDPDNKKVERQIALLQGKPVGPEPKQQKKAR